MAYHLSIFMDNRPGKLERITKILADNAINLRAISVASSGQFGIVKVLVNDPDKACALLKENHITAAKRRIMVAVVDDTPGGIHRLLVTLSSNTINIEDCYGFALAAAVIIEVEKYPEAEQILAANGIAVLSDEKIYAL
jgi:hypothetical protein